MRTVLACRTPAPQHWPFGNAANYHVARGRARPAGLRHSVVWSTVGACSTRRCGWKCDYVSPCGCMSASTGLRSPIPRLRRAADVGSLSSSSYECPAPRLAAELPSSGCQDLEQSACARHVVLTADVKLYYVVIEARLWTQCNRHQCGTAGSRTWLNLLLNYEWLWAHYFIHFSDIFYCNYYVDIKLMRLHQNISLYLLDYQGYLHSRFI